jgi:hypothetical protein
MRAQTRRQLQASGRGRLVGGDVVAAGGYDEHARVHRAIWTIRP